MLVKDFEGTTMKEVMAKIKKEFGKDAVILTKDEKPGHDGQHAFVSIRAAIPEDPIIQGASANPFTANDKTGIVDGFKSLERKLDTLQELILRNKDYLNLQTDLKDIKLLTMRGAQPLREGRSKDFPKELSKIEQHLTLMGLEPLYCDEIVEYLQSLPQIDSESQLESFYKNHAMRWMLKRVRIAPAIQVEKGSVSYHMFVGSPGSGKTTAMVKIAAQLKKEKGANILLVSYDSLRLAASEALRVYAKVLNIPFVQIFKIDDLPKAVEKVRDTDIVLIDTAGCSARDEEELQKLKALMDGVNLPLKTHLALSLVEKQAHLDHAIRTFSSIGINFLLFTKLDETWTYGEMYNLANRWSIPLSYFATGQNVPSDLERASRERVVERIFRL